MEDPTGSRENPEHFASTRHPEETLVTLRVLHKEERTVDHSREPVKVRGSEHHRDIINNASTNVFVIAGREDTFVSSP